MKPIVVVTIALTSLVSSHAIAADLPQAYQPVPVVMPPPPSWTGFYVGGNVGGAWQSLSATPVSIVNGGFINPGPINFNGSGVLAGGQAGFNYQISSFLVGLEGEFLWTDAKATTVTPGTLFPFIGGSSTGTAQTDWYATFGPRVGLVLNDLLLYGKGGVAFTSGSYAGTTGGFCCTTTVAPTTFTAVGWMIGGGAEWRFAYNWSLKGEYEYLNFGTKNFVTVGTTPGFLDVIATNSVKDTANIVKVGVNYRFGF